MQFTSILGETPYYLKPSEINYPSYFKDLNLDQIIGNIIEKWKNDYAIEKYFYYPAQTEQILSFRREVFLALADRDLTNAITNFSIYIKKSKKFIEYREDLSSLANSGKTTATLKCHHLLFDSAKFYITAIKELFSALEKYCYNLNKEKKTVCAGFLSFYSFLEDYCTSNKFVSLCSDVQKIEQTLSHLNFRIDLSGTKLVLHEDYETFDARAEIIRRCGMKIQASSAKMISPFNNILEIEDLEYLLLSMLYKKHKDIFQSLKDFSKQYENFYEPLLLQFEEEIQVYLATREFIASMEKQGFSFTWSKSVSKETAHFLLNDTYDLALACKYYFTPEKVIKNHCTLFPEERFFIITGPNQGGKTTFARAIGQAIYFHQMGFPIPGTSATLPIFSILLTHFPVEEDAKTGAGKLKEELSRLEPMIHSEIKNGFVILNELFTTAISYDAEIMGKHILHSFMEKGFFGIYVTHIQELAQTSEILEQKKEKINLKGIVSLMALVDKDEKTRTYHIVRAKAKGLAYAQTIAEKYRLSYEDILVRVKESNGS